MIMEVVCDDCGEVERIAYDPEFHRARMSLYELAFMDEHVICSGHEVDIVTGLIEL